MGKFKCNCDLFFETKKLITFEAGKWDELDFGTFFRTLIRSNPINFNVRGIPGLGKTHLSNYVSSHFLHCIYVDADIFLKRGNVQIDHCNEMLSVIAQIKDCIRHFKCNFCSSSTYPLVDKFEVDRMIFNGYDNIVAQMYIEGNEPELVRYSMSNSVHEPSETAMEKLVSKYVRWPGNTEETESLIALRKSNGKF